MAEITGEQIRRIEELVKGHLGELSNSLSFQAQKPLEDINEEYLKTLMERLESVIKSIALFKDSVYDENGKETAEMIIENLERIEW